MEIEPDAEIEPDSQKALLDKKEKRELKKINAAKEKAHKRLGAILSVGSGSEDISENPDPNLNSRTRKKKQRQRTKTAEPGLAKLKRVPPKTRERSKSEENLLSTVPDDADIDIVTSLGVGRSRGGKKAKPKKKKEETNAEKKKKGREQIDAAADNEAFDNAGDGHKIAAFDDDDDDVQIPNKPSLIIDGDEPNEEVVTHWQLDGKRRKPRTRKNKKETHLSEHVEKAIQKKRHDDGLLLCIIIHKADQVKPDARVRHPLIRVHLVNIDTGEYIKKTDRARNVTSIFENREGSDNIDYILPLLTQPYDFKTNRTLTPHWEEVLVYNEIYSYFLQREPDDPPVLIFFELLDFMQMNIKQKEFAKTDKGWYRIAWAFLKVVSPTGCTNTERQVRLQFYQPIRGVVKRKDDNSSLDIYHWWKYGQRIKYPSTIYVTVKGVTPPEKLQPSHRSMFPTQLERGTLTYDELSSAVEDNVGPTEQDQTPPMWTRLQGQSNMIPNKLHLYLPSRRKGCTVVQFSDNGRYLACACITDNSYPILVYEFPEGKLISSFENHFGIVYDLCWSVNGKELLSGSADSTVRCWDTKRFSSQVMKLFPHPSFVYVCKYHPQLQNIVVSAGYDQVIRIWNKISDNLQGILLRELNEHGGFVNSITFSKYGGRFYSADSVGVILEWSSPSEKKKKIDVDDIVTKWQLIKTIEVPELKKTTLNTILMHPSDNKLLIHSRDSMLHILDLRSYAILKSYTGGVNFKEHIHATFSTCGSFIFCGTEYGQVNVWSTETGNLLHSYTELSFTKAVSTVQFHPLDNYVVFCCYGDGHPIVIYSYDPKVKSESSQLSPRNTSIQRQNTMNSLDNATQSFRSLRMDTMITNDVERMAQMQEKLMSVTSQSVKNRVTFKDQTHNQKEYSFEPDQSSLSTWGSDFTYTLPGSPSLHRTQQQLDSPKYENVSKYQDRTSTPLKSSHKEADLPLTLSQLEDPYKVEVIEKKRGKKNR